MPHPQHDRVVITPRGSAASTLMAVPRICRVKMRQDVKTPSSVSGTSASSAPTGLQFTERALRVPRFAMDADELLARSLQEEEDRAAAAELLRREASANAVTSPREDFARRLDGGVRTVLAYENAEARAAALAVIPVARLKREADALVARAAERAAENERGSARADDGSVRVREISRRDALLLRLLRWFKREFFQWCDAPACLACGCADAPRPTGPGVPTPEEAKHGASRVETYACASATCGKAIRFPRFNDATKLLQTRVGRCGEWANCFALCCRALEFETRWVLDWTDHVWVEVYSDTQERWLHCDACEDACDAPKMYERGWGKKLSFVVAFGKDDVVDVTRRYVLDFEGETLGRRRAILPDPRDETWLADAIATRRDALRGGSARDSCSDEGEKARLRRLSSRDAREARSLAVSPIDEPASFRDDSRGRTTGSLAWRAARGELGDIGDIGELGCRTDDGETASEPKAPSRVSTPEDPVAAFVRAEFARLTTREKMSPNQAAARALETARKAFR